VILDEPDASTVLAEMPQEIRDQISREFPDLLLEPNLPYDLL
jgi:hypothetical protein